MFSRARPHETEAADRAPPVRLGLIEENRGPYRRALAEALPGEFHAYIDFFSNVRRLATLRRLLDPYLARDGLQVLNVACGPFAVEIFLAGLVRQQIVSFDYTAAFARAYPVLRREGFLANTCFLRGDIRSMALRPDSFDLIVMNDVLYESALFLPEVLTAVDPLLRPGGLICFDVVNAAARPLYAMMGRDHGFQRYRIADVERLLRDSGYAILAVERARGARAPLVAAAETALWHLTGLANTMAFLARKREASEQFAPGIGQTTSMSPQEKRHRDPS